MQTQISLREANQHFAHYVKQVEQGHDIVITRRGIPSVKIIAITGKKVLDEQQKAARIRMRAFMDKGYSLGGLRVKRDDIYEDRTNHS